jgi:hypothetical protein
MSNNPERLLCIIAYAGNPLAAGLRRAMEPRGFAFCAWEEAGAAERAPYWLLFTPHYGNGCYQSREALWAKHIQLARLDKKLLVATTAASTSPRHIDLVQEVEPLAADLANALRAEGPFQPAPSRAVDLTEKMRRFIDGHGTADRPDRSSVYAPFAAMRADLQAFSEALEDGYEPTELAERIFHGPTNAQFRNFTSRWESYFPYFEGLPVSPVFEHIDRLTKEVEDRFECPPTLLDLRQWILDTQPPLDEIYTSLQKIEPYVRD